MTQNIAIATSENAEQILNLATHIFENHGPDIGDAIINDNWILANLMEKAEQKVAGGLDFAEPVMKSENGNFGFRSHYADIPADIQDPTRELKFDPKAITGTLVINRKHFLQNQGKSEIKKLMTTLEMQGKSTIDNVVNSALWASAPAETEPESIQTIVAADPTTGSIGGFDRSTSTWARNLADSTTIADIGSEAGLTSLHQFRISLGGGKKSKADLGVTTEKLYGSLLGYLDTLRRARADEKMTKLGFDSVYVGPTKVSYDGNGGAGECPEGYFYFLSTQHLFLKILEGSYFKFEPFSFKGNNLNATSIFYMFLNLTTNNPRTMGVLTDITA